MTLEKSLDSLSLGFIDLSVIQGASTLCQALFQELGTQQ